SGQGGGDSAASQGRGGGGGQREDHRDSPGRRLDVRSTGQQHDHEIGRGGRAEHAAGARLQARRSGHRLSHHDLGPVPHRDGSRIHAVAGDPRETEYSDGILANSLSQTANSKELGHFLLSARYELFASSLYNSPYFLSRYVRNGSGDRLLPVTRCTK